MIVAVSYAEQIGHLRSVACPRCHARPGDPCTTPNGYTTRHKDRDRALAGTAPKPRANGLRLTEAQAERIERAAANGGDYWAPRPGGQALFSGDGAERQVATALLDKGLFELVDAAVRNLSSEAHYRLTADGWRVYATHRLIIRRDGVTIPEGVLT